MTCTRNHDKLFITNDSAVYTEVQQKGNNLIPKIFIDSVLNSVNNISHSISGSTLLDMDLRGKVQQLLPRRALTKYSN